ncbi:MAG: 30S ribosomal protein S8 [Bacteroidota bacterium]
MNTDPIADFLTRIRNAMGAGHKVVEIPSSNLKQEMTRVLFESGYIRKYKFVDAAPQGSIKIALKYDKLTRKPAITKLERVSKPGLRKYSKSTEIPYVKNGLGIAILSTPSGVMTDKQARRDNVGGEILCNVY